MKIILIFIYLMQMRFITWSLTAVCDYKFGDFVLLLRKYDCEVRKEFEITSRNSTLITTVTGLHKNKRSNNDVAVFKVNNLKVNYFPNGLENFFKNLEGIAINFCELKEVNQNDLKPFSNLTYLDLNNNKIEIITAETFKYNQNLKLIWLKRNQIYHIDSNAFDGLGELTNLNLQSNNCVDAKGVNVVAVKQVIEALNHTCICQEYLARKINELETVKLDEMAVKNDNLVNTVTEPVNSSDILFESIKMIIIEKLEENFNKTQELFTNFAAKVNKIELELADTKNQLTDYQNTNLKSTNETLKTLEAFQESQSQILLNLSTKCEPAEDTTSNYLNETLKTILETQNSISQDFQTFKNSQMESNLSQNITLISDDLDQVKRTLSNTETYVAMTIETNARHTTSEIAKLKQNIEEIEDRITKDIQVELRTVKSDLEDMKRNNQNERNIPIITTIFSTTRTSIENATKLNEIDERNENTDIDETTIAAVAETTKSEENNEITARSDLDNPEDSIDKATQATENAKNSSTTSVDQLVMDSLDKPEDITKPTIEVKQNEEDNSTVPMVNNLTINVTNIQEASLPEPTDNTTEQTKEVVTESFTEITEKDSTTQANITVQDPSALSTDNKENSTIESENNNQTEASKQTLASQAPESISSSTTQANESSAITTAASSTHSIASNIEDPPVLEETTFKSPTNDTEAAAPISKEDEV